MLIIRAATNIVFFIMQYCSYYADCHVDITNAENYTSLRGPERAAAIFKNNFSQ